MTPIGKRKIHTRNNRNNSNNNNNNSNNITWNIRHNPPPEILERIRQKEAELRKEYPTNIIDLQLLEVIPPPKNKKALFNTYTYRFGSSIHPEFSYNMLHKYDNRKYIDPIRIQSPIHSVSPKHLTKKQKSNPNNKKSKNTYNMYMRLMNAYKRTNTLKN